jgi:EmrB/QacA subfamily drug resistance transporter
MSDPRGAARARAASATSTAVWTLAVTAIAFFMVALDSLVVATALPAIHRDLGGSIATLEWTVNAFTLTYAAGIITAAALGDRFGRRLIFAFGLAVFTAASTLCALAPTAGFLIAARAVQGVGAAMVMPLSLTILVSTFPAERRGAIVGIWGAIGGIAVASGPLVGGAITQGLSWHWIFWLNVPIGLIGILLLFARLPESKGSATALDPIATFLVAGGAAGLIWGLIQAGDQGWLALPTAATLAAGFTSLVAFAIWERRAVQPMLPLSLFRGRSFSSASVTAFLMMGTLSAAVFFVAQYLQFGLRLSPLNAGIRMLPWTATPLVVAVLAGFVSDRIGRRTVLVAGMFLQGTGLLWFAALTTTSVSYGQLILPLFLAGLGIGMAMPTVSTVVVSSVPPQDMGKASGVNSTVQRFGAAFAVAVGSLVFASNGHIGTPAAFVSGFRPALTVIASLSLFGALIALGAQPRRSPMTQQASLESAEVA